jgi:hypothetical protein
MVGIIFVAVMVSCICSCCYQACFCKFLEEISKHLKFQAPHYFFLFGNKATREWGKLLQYSLLAGTTL